MLIRNVDRLVSGVPELAQHRWPARARAAVAHRPRRAASELAEGMQQADGNAAPLELHMGTFVAGKKVTTTGSFRCSRTSSRMHAALRGWHKRRVRRRARRRLVPRRDQGPRPRNPSRSPRASLRSVLHVPPWQPGASPAHRPRPGDRESGCERLRRIAQRREQSRRRGALRGSVAPGGSVVPGVIARRRL